MRFKPLPAAMFLLFLLMGTAATAQSGARAQSTPGTQSPMHGLIGKMKAAPGQRDALIAILLEGIGDMPGCISYVVARDPQDPDAIWITEVWDSAESHKASLAIPAVQAAITRARPLIAGFEQHVQTAPVGGVGIP